jgi:polyketide synthase 12
MVTDDRLPGGEGAGTVIETGPGVTGLSPGDRVMGVFPTGIGPVAITDHQMLAPVPPGWTFVQAATAPIAFMTAYYGLVDLADCRPGQRLLIHAAAGGVGMAAIQLARYLGADIYATASPGKHPALHALGLPPEHIASSRTLDFEDRFRPVGLEIVLNSLAGDFTDASLRLLALGGQFLDMGKTDIRDPAAVASRHPGVTYQAFDLMDPGLARLAQILTELTRLFTDGTLQPLPATCWDIRRAPEAFRHMSQARHTGKIVLTIPRQPDPAGTTLITGGTGTLGSILARHLAANGTRHLLLLSRRGTIAPGAADLAADLTRLGATATITPCDTADPVAIAAALDSIPPSRPLTTVIHTAGTISDAIITELTADHLEATWRSKATTAWNLHQLTAGLDLTDFVVYSSVAGTLGTPGQASYAAANVFLDALATHRRTHGLPATSLAWGLWQPASGLTASLTQADHARLARHGIVPMSADHALRLYDTTHNQPHPHVIPASLDLTALHQTPPILSALVRTPRLRSAVNANDVSPTAAGRLAGLTGSEQEEFLITRVLTNVAAVLGHRDTATIGADRAFSQIGFDSLTAVELRNRLAADVGVALPAAVVFDHPTPTALARHIRTLITGPETGDRDDIESGLREALASIPIDRLREAGILEILLKMAGDPAHPGMSRTREIDDMDAEDLIKIALNSD